MKEQSERSIILVGVDYSENSINALKTASRVSNSRELPLVCYHILDEDMLRDATRTKSFVKEEILELAQTKLDGFIREHLGTANEISSLVTIGNPFVETIQLIEKHDVNMLVLGSRGFQTKEYYQVGALASKCARKAPVDLMLVRDTQVHPFKRIIACVDFSENSIQALDRAAKVAELNNADLRIIHIQKPHIYSDVEMGWLGPAFPQKEEVDLTKLYQTQLHELKEEIEKKYDLNSVSTRIYRSASASEGIYIGLKEFQAELCVLCTRGRTGLKSLLLGTEAEKIITSSPCSTLIIKPNGFSFTLK